MKLLLRLLASAAATAVAVWLIPGITLTADTVQDQVLTLLGVAVILGLVNAVVKPFAAALGTCLIVLTFGLFLLVINALMLMLTSWVAGQVGLGFMVDGFWAALLGSLVISLVSAVAGSVLGLRDSD
ncbi:hypothetical protein BCR15_06205 [Tessaracoccus lapidicaptus]|uniref:Uncharacterized protein n=1 Tax=Tessaracoccus lapidicaptus TaxID=1427523 RepID=A0A1C0ALF8_9ACTN|nr:MULTISPECIES: phage holin family protein [Tessaracoccus]AQX16107.1 hypothetical protein BKM78_09420 [Tessaracoccus sp. T2.5-30]OCL33409.1 hypothetical protein BCR15_06205 [Tessaracoccus lapidicaptus]VEP40655.1 hypothetical protein TLA_TLA_01903 [Tessaracoccus lapidicaptus]